MDLLSLFMYFYIKSTLCFIFARRPPMILLSSKFTLKSVLSLRTSYKVMILQGFFLFPAFTIVSTVFTRCLLTVLRELYRKITLTCVKVSLFGIYYLTGAILRLRDLD